MSGLLSLLVALIIIGVVLYLVNLIPMDGAIKKIINIVVVLLVVLWLISALFGGVALPKLNLQ